MPPELGLAVDRALSAAAIRVVDQTGIWASHVEGLAEGFESRLRVKAVAGSPADDAPSERIKDDGQMQPTLTGPDMIDIGFHLSSGRSAETF